MIGNHINKPSLPACRFTVSRLIKTDVINNRVRLNAYLPTLKSVLSLDSSIDYTCRDRALQNTATLRAGRKSFLLKKQFLFLKMCPLYAFRLHHAVILLYNDFLYD